MSLKSHIIVIIVEIETFWKENIFRHVVDPFWVPKSFGQTKLSSDDPIFNKMVDHLKVLQMLEIYLLYLKGELIIKTRTIEVGISDPSSFNKGIFKIFVSSCNNEHFFSLFESVFLFPLS